MYRWDAARAGMSIFFVGFFHDNVHGDVHERKGVKDGEWDCFRMCMRRIERSAGLRKVQLCGRVCLGDDPCKDT
jgi:hypothetical protein